VEVSVLRYKELEVYALVETLMPHAIQKVRTNLMIRGAALEIAAITRHLFERNRGPRA